MKLEIRVFKEAPKPEKGFAGRELLAEGLLGARYVCRVDGLAEGEVSARTVPELMGKIGETVGRLSRKDARELQFRFALDDMPEERRGALLVQLEGSEISEVFNGIDRIFERNDKEK